MIPSAGSFALASARYSGDCTGERENRERTGIFSEIECLSLENLRESVNGVQIIAAKESPANGTDEKNTNIRRRADKIV